MKFYTTEYYREKIEDRQLDYILFVPNNVEKYITNKEKMYSLCFRVWMTNIDKVTDVPEDLVEIKFEDLNEEEKYVFLMRIMYVCNHYKGSDFNVLIGRKLEKELFEFIKNQIMYNKENQSFYIDREFYSKFNTLANNKPSNILYEFKYIKGAELYKTDKNKIVFKVLDTGFFYRTVICITLNNTICDDPSAKTETLEPYMLLFNESIKKKITKLSFEAIIKNINKSLEKNKTGLSNAQMLALLYAEEIEEKIKEIKESDLMNECKNICSN